METNEKTSRRSNNNSNNHNIERQHQSLHQDIIFDILARVPAGSLVRFKSVCKLWFSLISDPNFVKFHLRIWKSKPMIILEKPEFHYFFSFDFQERETRAKRLHPLRNFQYWLRTDPYLVASTDGLLLFRGSGYYESKTKLCLYNPVTGKQQLLPHNPNLNLFGCKYSLVHDALFKKYKVVAYFSRPKFGCIHDKCGIFTVDKNGDGGENATWRELSYPFPIFMTSSFTPVAANGALNWIAYTLDKLEKQVAFIQSMDIARETIREGIVLPCQPRIADKKLINCSLLEMKGSLYFANPASHEELDIWVLDDWVNHSWINQHKICLSSMVGKPDGMASFLAINSFYPFFVMENHSSHPAEILIRHEPHNTNLLHETGSYSYDLKSEELRPIAIRSEELKSDYIPRCIHVNSLVCWDC